MTQFEAFLKKHNLTTCGLAKRVGLSKSQVSEYRRDLHRPSQRTARRIALALRLSVDEVLRDIPVRETSENRPKRVVHCITCGRRLWRLPNPAQVEVTGQSENTAYAG